MGSQCTLLDHGYSKSCGSMVLAQDCFSSEVADQAVNRGKSASLQVDKKTETQ